MTEQLGKCGSFTPVGAADVDGLYPDQTEVPEWHSVVSAAVSSTNLVIQPQLHPDQKLTVITTGVRRYWIASTEIPLSWFIEPPSDSAPGAIIELNPEILSVLVAAMDNAKSLATCEGTPDTAAIIEYNRLIRQLVEDDHFKVTDRINVPITRFGCGLCG